MKGVLSRLPWARQFPRARCSPYSNFLSPTRRFWMQKRRSVSESEERNFTDPNKLLWESLLNHAREQDEALKLCLEIQDFCCHPLPNAQWVTTKIFNFRGSLCDRETSQWRLEPFSRKHESVADDLQHLCEAMVLTTLLVRPGLSHLSDRSPCHKSRDSEIPSWVPSQERPG